MTGSNQTNTPAVETADDPENTAVHNQHRGDLSPRANATAKGNAPVGPNTPAPGREMSVTTTVAGLHGNSDVDSPTNHRALQRFMREQVFGATHVARTGSSPIGEDQTIAAVCPVCREVHTTLGYCPRASEASMGLGLYRDEGIGGVPGPGSESLELDANDPRNDPYAVGALPWKLRPDGVYRPVAPGTQEAREAMRVREANLEVPSEFEGKTLFRGWH